MIWYCWKNGSHIVGRSIEGLLIRGITESMIFEIEADTQIEAKQKASVIIKAVNSEARNRTSRTTGDWQS